MKKKSMKKWLALLLAGIMTVTPVSTAYAESDDAAASAVEVSIVQDTEDEDEPAAEIPETGDVEELPETGSVEDTTEQDVEDTTVSDETEDAAETEDTAETVEETDLDETGEPGETADQPKSDVSGNDADETDGNGDAAEEEIPQEKNHKAPELEMELTAAMVAEKVELQGTADRLEGYQGDVQYAAHEAVFFADTKDYANTVAKGYGATLSSYENGVAVISFDEEATEIIAMAEDSDVLLPAVYPNYIYYTCNELVEYDEQSADLNVAATGKTDPYLSTDQYYHDEINSSGAWSYNSKAGKGVKVAVIDSGIEKGHEDLKGRVGSTSSTYTGIYGNKSYNGAADNDRHGTHVAGIIAANKDNGKGGAGIAYNATIVSIKALEENPLKSTASGSTAGIIQAVNAAVKSGARVINMSLGGPYYDALFESVVNAAVNKGVVVVAAAGNDSKSLSKTKTSSNYYSPACFDNVITVSAKQKGSASLASFSNYGSGIIDITAPGTSIYSTVPSSSYAAIDGTSQAAPMVAAAAAYIISVRPDLQKAKTKTTVDMVKKILQDSATKTGYTNSANFGSGLLNVEAAIKMAAPSAANNTELQAPKVTIGGSAVTNSQTIQSTDAITLTSALGTTADSNIKIYYTLDGKNPTEKSTLYTGAFSIGASGSKTLKAVAVYYGTQSAVTTLKVKVNANVTSFSIKSKTGSSYLSAGKTLTLIAYNFRPTYATNQKVTWEITSGSEYASIDTKGVLKAKAGITEQQTVTVQATADGSGVTAKKTITLVPAATALKLSDAKDASVKLEYPDTKQMIVVATPAAAKVSVTYTSSNTKVATVTSTGQVRAVGAGTATITAQTTDGSNKKVTMKVTVTKAVQSVSVTSKTGLYQTASGKTLQMVATVTSNATNKQVKWTVESGQDAATISASGALKAGKVNAVSTVKVRATAVDGSGKYGEATVTIYPSAANKIALEDGNSCTLGTVTKGTFTTSVQLHPYTDNYDSNASYGRQKDSGTTNLGNFTYTSSNTKVAMVSETGLVTARAVGSATIKITAKDGSGKSVSCKVKVVKPVTSISVYSKNSMTIVGKGKSLSLGALTNSDATNKKVTWTSSDTSVATVDKNGKVTGKSYGTSSTNTATAKITATAADGSGVTSTFTVTVTPAVKKFQFHVRKLFTYSWSSAAVTTMSKGSSEKLSYYCPYIFDEVSGNTTPNTSDALYAYYYDIVDLSCSNSNVIQINTGADGYTYLIPVSKGKATITYKTLDGSNKKCKLTITVY